MTEKAASIAVKICGLKTADALDAAIDAGADYIGLVFFPKSPRNVDGAAARTLAGRSRGRVEIVALLVDPTDSDIADAMSAADPDILQLHGAESPDRVRAIATATGRRVMKAIKVETAADAALALAYKDAADLILFDAKAPKGAVLPGGNGVPFDWRALADVTPQLAGRWMLSGGLTPDNVPEAIRLTAAPAVDVSSGVECAPGVKDAALIRRFLQAAKTAKQSA